MLSGQSSLTEIFSPAVGGVRFSRRAAPFAVVGVMFLAGCSSTTNRAPVVDLSSGAAPSSVSEPVPASGTYVVKPGDSLYRIARTYNLDVESLKRWNNIGDANQISVGQVLALTGSSAGSVAVAKPVTPSTPSTPPATSTPSTPSTPPATAKPTTPATPATPSTTPPTVVAPSQPAPERAADASAVNWGWPAQGSVAQKFSAATKGIDIAGNIGDPVVAAADGKVMYSGNGVRGLGNLIIINHAGGFITAYAHNSTLLVKTGQDVTRGTKIAELGQSDTTSPKLHFEIRRQGTPVDPLQYLPAQ